MTDSRPCTEGDRPASDVKAQHSAPPRLRKKPEDTVEGCRDRARSDLAIAATMGTPNGKLRLEHSAAAWSGRADLIQRLSDSMDVTQAAARVAASAAAASRRKPVGQALHVQI